MAAIGALKHDVTPLRDVGTPSGCWGPCKQSSFRTAYVECPKPDQHEGVQMVPGFYDLLLQAGSEEDGAHELSDHSALTGGREKSS